MSHVHTNVDLANMLILAYRMHKNDKSKPDQQFLQMDGCNANLLYSFWVLRWNPVDFKKSVFPTVRFFQERTYIRL